MIRKQPNKEQLPTHTADYVIVVNIKSVYATTNFWNHLKTFVKIEEKYFF